MTFTWNSHLHVQISKNIYNLVQTFYKSFFKLIYTFKIHTQDWIYSFFYTNSFYLQFFFNNSVYIYICNGNFAYYLLTYILDKVSEIYLENIQLQYVISTFISFPTKIYILVFKNKIHLYLLLDSYIQWLHCNIYMGSILHMKII